MAEPCRICGKRTCTFIRNKESFLDGAMCVLDAIDEMPTIDAKPVVHCKDCIHNVANMQKDPLDITDYTDITCDYFMTDGMDQEDYCSKGERVSE